jgi:sugar-specific transcriptional regulator TrmB
MLRYSSTAPPLYERVPISELLQGRRGKHDELVKGVLRYLSTLPRNEAMRIRLNSVRGISLGNLRSAISRAAKTRKIKIQTYSDSDYMYLWKPDGLKKSLAGKKQGGKSPQN